MSCISGESKRRDFAAKASSSMPGLLGLGWKKNLKLSPGNHLQHTIKRPGPADLNVPCARPLHPSGLTGRPKASPNLPPPLPAPAPVRAPTPEPRSRGGIFVVPRHPKKHFWSSARSGIWKHHPLKTGTLRRMASSGGGCRVRETIKQTAELPT